MRQKRIEIYGKLPANYAGDTFTYTARQTQQQQQLLNKLYSVGTLPPSPPPPLLLPRRLPHNASEYNKLSLARVDYDVRQKGGANCVRGRVCVVAAAATSMSLWETAVKSALTFLSNTQIHVAVSRGAGWVSVRTRIWFVEFSLLRTSHHFCHASSFLGDDGVYVRVCVCARVLPPQTPRSVLRVCV